MEVEASARLFRGKRALRDRVVQESNELGVVPMGRKCTRRTGIRNRRLGSPSRFGWSCAACTCRLVRIELKEAGGTA